jgi:hypothetical protein
MRLQELDSVELTRDLPPFVRGTRGVVVLVYPSGKQVEVEFLNPKGDTLGVESVPMAFLRKVPRAPKPKAAPRKVSSQELVKLLAQEGNVSDRRIGQPHPKAFGPPCGPKAGGLEGDKRASRIG